MGGAQGPPREGKSALLAEVGVVTPQGTVPSRDALAALTGERGAGAAGVLWVKARDTAEHATVHGTGLTTKNYPVPERQEGGG